MNELLTLKTHIPPPFVHRLRSEDLIDSKLFNTKKRNNILLALFIAFSLPWAQKETQRCSEYSAQKACVLAFISMLLWQAVMVAAFPDNGDVMTRH